MKKLLLALFISVVPCFGVSVDKELVHIDGIKIALFAPDGTAIITHSEYARPGLDGTQRSLDDQMSEKLIYYEAKSKYPMLSNQDDIDKGLNAIMKANNMNSEDLDAMFAQANYTPEEGREQFGVMTMVNQVMNYKVNSQVVIPEKAKIAYYEENPVVEHAEYLLQRGIIVDGEGLNQDEIQEKLKKDLNSVAIEWRDPYWIQDNELASDKRYLTNLSVGELSPVSKTAQGFDVYRLMQRKEERIVPYDEREQEITALLREPKYMQLLQKYQKELFDNATIVRFDQEK